MSCHPTTAPPTLASNGGRLGLSSEDVAELERELDLYVAFWAHAREGRIQRLQVGERE